MAKTCSIYLYSYHNVCSKLPLKAKIIKNKGCRPVLF